MGLLGTTSAVGTALGPSLGGLLIAAFGWRAVFFALAPLGLVALVLAWRYLPVDRPAVLAERATLRVNARTLLTLLKGRALSAALAANALVSTVMMSTLVVGPFYLTRTLGLPTEAVGVALSLGPVVTALTGIPAGRLTDRFGAERVAIAGLTGMASGALALAMLPSALGVVAYLLPIAVLTSAYGFFQTANNAAVMTDVATDRRGVTSGLLNFSRNLGLMAGASLMGSVFAIAASHVDIAMVAPAAVASGMRATFIVATALIVVALTIALSSYLSETTMTARRRIISSLFVLTALVSFAPITEAQTKTDTIYVTQVTPSWSIGAVSVQFGAARLGLSDLNAAMIANGRPAVASELASLGLTGHARFGRFILGGTGEAANQRRIASGWSKTPASPTAPHSRVRDAG
jgi:predicted MFS family arabinose efflux permease